MERRNGTVRLLALTLGTLTLLTACSGGGGNDAVETTASTTRSDVAVEYPGEIVRPRSAEEAVKALESLETLDFDGAATVIATYSHADILCPESASDEISAAALARNRAIEKKYNTTVTGKRTESREALLSEVRSSVKSGLYYADIIAIDISEIGTYNSDSLLMNLYSLPDFDPTADIFNTDAMSQLSAAFRSYGVISAATEDVRDVYAVYWNKAIAESLGAGDLYGEYERGEWTWQRFSVLMHSAAEARGADKATRIGAVTDLQLNELADAMQTSSGLHYVSTGYGAVPSISYDDAAMNELASLAHTVFGSGQGFSSGSGSDTSAATSFRGGDVLFYVGTFRDAETLASAESDWGVLPLPTYSDKTGITAMSPSSAVLVTPRNNALGANTSAMLKALSVASVGVMDDAAVEYITASALRDNASARMVRAAAEKTALTDFTAAFPSITALQNATAEAYHSSIKSGGSFTTVANRYLRNGTAALNQNFPLKNAE